jgi:hypothetical protein
METYLFLTLAGLGWMLGRDRTRDRPPVPTRTGMAVAPVASASASSFSRMGVAAASAGAQGARVRAHDAPSMRSMYDSSALQAARATEASVATRSAQAAMHPMQTNRVPPNDADAVFVSPLTGRALPVSQFTHNNMVPFFGGTVKQNVSQGAFTSRLEAFTGVDQDRPYGTKEERDAFFAPRANDANHGGAADHIRTAFLSTMEGPKRRAFEQPAAMLVGKAGIAGGETGDVYYDQRAYTRDRTVDELRVASRPKTTFDGRVLSGEAHTAARPELPMVVKQQTRQPLKVQNGPDDFFRTTGAYTVQSARPEQILPCTARQVTGANSFYVGPGGSTAVARDSRQRDAMVAETHRVTLCGPQAGPAAPQQPRANDYGKAGNVAYPNERDVTGTRTYQSAVTTAIKALIAPITDIFKPTRKEDLVDAQRMFGNVVPGVVAQPKLTIYDANDVARTTLKETGLVEAPLANLRGNHRPGVAYDPADVPRTALKETTLAEAALVNLYGGNVRHMLTVHDPDDVARTSMKETTLRDGTMDGRLGGGMGARGYNRDPDVDARVTTRNTLGCVDTTLNPSMSRAAGTIVDPDAWRTPHTLREMTERFGQTDGADGAVGGLQNRGRQGAYATAANDVRDTQRQTLAATGVEYGGASIAAGVAPGGYGVAPIDMPDTQRMVLSDNDYYGVGTSAATGGAATSQEMEHAMGIRNDRDVIAAELDVRAPTTEGAKAGTSVEQYGDGAHLEPQRASVQYDGYERTSPRALQVASGSVGDVAQDRVPAELTADQADRRFTQDIMGAEAQRGHNPYAIGAFAARQGL